MPPERGQLRARLSAAHTKLKELRRPRTRDVEGTLRSTTKDFYLKQDVKEIWDDYLLPIVTLFQLDRHEESHIRSRLILTLAILILIDAIEVIEEFPNNFIRIEAQSHADGPIWKELDSHLPAPQSSLAFLNAAQLDLFINMQHHFKPLVIDQDVIYDENMVLGPLPIELIAGRVAEGAFGYIDRIEIAAKHLRVGGKLEVRLENI